jgi:hypothetical protein
VYEHTHLITDNGRFRFSLLKFQEKASQVFFANTFCRKDCSQSLSLSEHTVNATLLFKGYRHIFTLILIIIVQRKVVNYFQKSIDLYMDNILQ